MKKFDVEITETLQRKVSVEAASQEDAERMVTQAWNNQDYVLDSGDFTGVDFKTVGEHELAETRTMDVLLVQPNAYPKKISVGTELEDLQAMVGGDIEVTYPFEDEVAIILNESGKINGLPLNRAIYTEDGDMSRGDLRAALQKLVSRGMLEVVDVPRKRREAAEIAEATGLFGKRGEAQDADANGMTKKKREPRKIRLELLPASDAVLQDIAAAERDYEQAKFRGFTEDELRQYTALERRVQENEKQILQK